MFDLKLHSKSRLLRAATYGRGIWERKLDVNEMPDSTLYFRKHALDDGWSSEPPGPDVAIMPYDQAEQLLLQGERLWWWQGADTKIDTLTVILLRIKPKRKLISVHMSGLWSTQTPVGT